MWTWRPALCRDDDGLVMSVSSLLIAAVFQPLAKNAILMGRSILDLLARSAAPRPHCEQCAARNENDGDGSLRLSGSDAAAVAASLGMPLSSSTLAPCGGGCEAMGVVEEVAWGGKEAGEAELREAFEVFDRDGDGLVSAAELWGVLRRLGMAEGTRYEDCAAMVDAAAARHGGGGGDGGVGFREFRAMMEHAV